MAEHAHTCPGFTAEGSGYKGESAESFKATRVYHLALYDEKSPQ